MKTPTPKEVTDLFGILNKPKEPTCKACNKPLHTVDKLGVCTTVGCRLHTIWVGL